MVFYTGEFDLTDIKRQQQDIEQIEPKFSENLLKVATQIESDYLPLLQQYPQEAVKPFAFKTPKSRRYYFYLISIGAVNTDGQKYIRTGGYAQSWRVDLDQSGATYTLSVYSDFPAAQFVGGLRQVPGHQNTGWMKYQPILADIGTFMDTMVKRLV